MSPAIYAFHAKRHGFISIARPLLSLPADASKENMEHVAEMAYGYVLLICYAVFMMHIRLCTSIAERAALEDKCKASLIDALISIIRAIAAILWMDEDTAILCHLAATPATL